MYKYEVIIYWSDEDDAYIAEVPELGYCMADGATRAEALENIESGIDQYVETLKELGQPIPEPKGRMSTV